MPEARGGGCDVDSDAKIRLRREKKKKRPFFFFRTAVSKAKPKIRISESNVEFIRTLPDVSVFGAAKARKVGRRGANAGFAIKNRASLFQRCNPLSGLRMRPSSARRRSDPLSGSGGESANNLIFFAAGAHRVGKNRNFVRVKENPRIMIYDNILGTIGSTPMVRLNHFSPNRQVNIFAKLEGFNLRAASRTALRSR